MPNDLGPNQPAMQDGSRHGFQSIRTQLETAARDDFDAAVQVLKRSGLLRLSDWNGSATAMREVAASNLSLGRLFEGHVNARALITTYAEPELRASCLAEMDDGLMFGVWGADGATPVTAKGTALLGGKRFASGLGLVDRAIVTAATPQGQQLFVIAADDPARQDPAAWDMSGMRESRSGGFDCSGLPGRPLGQPDIYVQEPHFVGGTWRIAAVTLGGITALLERSAAVLRDRGQSEAEPHLLRLAPVAGRVLAAWPAILKAGKVASGPQGARDPQAAAIRSVAARLLAEEIGQDAIAAVERSIGLSMFTETDPVGQSARDLACYMRQAARDAFSVKVGRALLVGDRPLGAWLDD